MFAIFLQMVHNNKQQQKRTRDRKKMWQILYVGLKNLKLKS